MITFDQAEERVREWLLVQERAMNSFGSALPSYSKKEHDHLVISNTEKYDFGWVFYWNTQKYIETGDDRHALGGNAPMIVDRDSGNLHVTGTARRTSAYIDEYRKQKYA
jgi:hypothetical protein